jgi:hypothetical protein
MHPTSTATLTGPSTGPIKDPWEEVIRETLKISKNRAAEITKVVESVGNYVKEGEVTDTKRLEQ